MVDPEDFRLYAWADWMGLPPVEGRPCIRTARRHPPEVVSLTHFDRLPTAAVAFSRRNVAKRDHYTCQYCGAQPGVADLTVNHVIPRAQGGGSTWTNCVVACAGCNARKADRTPEQAGMRLKKTPARPEWKPLYSVRDLARDHHLQGWHAFLGDPGERVRA